MSTEKGKMAASRLYDASGPELVAGPRHACELLARLNNSTDSQCDLRQQSYAALCRSTGKAVAIEPPFYCDYGTNIYLGDRVFFNFNCIVRDPAEVHIGSEVLFGPAVQICTATQPLN